MKFLALPLLFLIVSCGQSVSPVDSGLDNQIFHFGNGTEPQGLDPHIVTGVPENHLLTAYFLTNATNVKMAVICKNPIIS